MPDTKITALAAITTVDPAADVLPIVDISDTSMAASGTTKKITSNQILGAGGTATLASATITGDLTVDTNVLKVDTTNNRVGIRTASPTEPLTVDNSSGVTTGAIRIYATDQSHSRLSIQNGNGQAYHLVAGNPGASNAGFALYDNTATATRWYVDNTGVHTWQNVGGVAGTAMTLNSTGLGVGKVPASNQSKVQIYQALGTSLNGALHITDDATTSFVFNNTSSGVSSIWTSGVLTFSTGSNAYSTNGARMTLDASGILLIGTTNNVIWNTTNQGCVVGGNAVQASRSNDVSLLLNRIGSNGKIAAFAREGLEVGDISVTTTGTTFNSTSDYRLKEAVAPLSGGLARVSALKPSIYKWKSNGSSGEGFLAHELAEVVPAAVSGEKDAVNEDGTIKAQSIDMSRVVPILVAAIQELTARVQTLETR